MMSDPRANDATVLEPAALAAPCRDGVDSRCLGMLSTALVKITGRLLPKVAGKAGLTWHQKHLEILAQVLGSVLRADPVDRQVSALESNVADYVNAVTATVREVRRTIPSTPFAGFGPASIILIPVLRQDPRFVAAFNNYLDSYQRASETALAVVEGYYDNGRRIEADTPARLNEIRTAVGRLPEKNNIDIVLKQQLRKRIDFIELTVMTRVQEARSTAQDTTRYLRQAFATAQQVQRLPTR